MPLNSLFKKAFLIICLFIFHSGPSVKAQRNTIIDSLATQLKITTAAAQKTAVLIQLIDIALENSFYSPINDDSLRSYLKLLKELSFSHKIINIEAYNYFLDGIELSAQ